MNKREIFTSLLNRRAESSFRTTFTISQEAVDGLKWLSDNLGIAFKDIIDTILNEHQPNTDNSENSTCIQEIISKLNGVQFETIKLSIRKTLSVSQNAIHSLSQLSKDKNISRDILVNQIIIYSRSCIEEMIVEIEKNHKEALQMINNWVQEGKNIDEKLHEMLAPNDLIVDEFKNTLNYVEDRNKSVSERLCNGEN
ncbi:MAG: hypothetical protein P9X24_06820 [Candidatus Hatepunaea meridiana]|nr:hypothetical protein [Candidatus Hatepunaea meridiana]